MRPPAAAPSATSGAGRRRGSARRGLSPRRLFLEAALKYIEPDELVEITPTATRVRKRMLDEASRRRAKRNERSRAAAQ
jgi:predicted membrane GTPase involved in stress response